MSEVKLNLIDAQGTLTGTIHGSVTDSCVAALSAEPETIAELEAALGRYIRQQAGKSAFASFHHASEIDSEPWDAGLVIIDLAARVVAAESSYSQPQAEGEVCYHDGTNLTDISVPYRLPPDWLFVNSVEAYLWACPRRRQQRAENLPFDARSVLYGSALLEFVVKSGVRWLERISEEAVDVAEAKLAQEITGIHETWLTTPHEDLRGQSPRDVLLAKQDLIDFDLDTRSLQWTLQGEGPPCLAPDSFAYRYAGFGTHEWVVYYDLVRHLLWRATELDCRDVAAAVSKLERFKTAWLETGDGEYEGKVPAIIIDNERRRLPQAMTAAELIIDEDCDVCRMSALHAEMGCGPGFWHLDGSHMDDGFAFSTCLTLEEWEAENRRREEFNREFERDWEERQQRIANGGDRIDSIDGEAANHGDTANDSETTEDRENANDGENANDAEHANDAELVN
jgi:hypothetical protein